MIMTKKLEIPDLNELPKKVEVEEDHQQPTTKSLLVYTRRRKGNPNDNYLYSPPNKWIKVISAETTKPVVDAISTSIKVEANSSTTACSSCHIDFESSARHSHNLSFSLSLECASHYKCRYI
ncbi:hypothetical protein CsatB_011870 [Cannabis sativa]